MFDCLTQVLDVLTRKLAPGDHDHINQPVSFLHGQIIKHEMPRLMKVHRQANDVIFVLSAPTSRPDVVLVVAPHHDLRAFSAPCLDARAAAV